MFAPRWFWLVVACCLVVITAAAVVHLRYKSLSEQRYLDTWTHRICMTDDGACFAHL